MLGRGCAESTDLEIVDDGIRRLLPRRLRQRVAAELLLGLRRRSLARRDNGHPHIDATQRTIASREGRAIQGMSMGGFGSLKLALKYPDLFQRCSLPEAIANRGK